MKLTRLFVALVFCTGIAGVGYSSDSILKEIEGMPLVYSDDFDRGAGRWEPTDVTAWRILMEKGNPVFSLFGASRYEPPVRSPLNIALIKDLWVSSFVLELKAKQTGREYGHRDLCFFYNWKDPSHFYYTHLASVADPHANSIFLVNAEPRVSIAKERTKGTKWIDGKYHTIRIVRKADDGSIKVFFDDLTKPVMVANDKTFTSGRIGVGSFDDTGNFDTVRVWGIEAEPPR